MNTRLRLMMRTRVLIALLTFAGLGLVTQRALAAVWFQCSGKPWQGVQSFTTFLIDRCDSPSGSTEDDVLSYGVDHWGDLNGMLARFGLASGDSSCSVPASSSGNWEIALVPSNDPLLDGNFGLADKWTYSDCTNTGKVLGASVVINQNLDISSVSEIDPGLGGRETLIHELGHVLGAFHEDSMLSVMCSANSCGKLSRQSALGGTIGTVKSESRLPNDSWFGYTAHSSGGAGTIDPITSAWTFTNRGVLNYPGTTTRTKCPGETTTVKFTFGNLGKPDITSGNPVGYRIVMSTNGYFSAISPDITVSNGTFFAGGGLFGTTTVTVTVPSAAANTYRVGVVADPTNARVEDEEYNNAGDTGLRITIPPSGC